MNSYFQISVTICLFMLGFVLAGNLIVAVAPDAFPDPSITSNPNLANQTNALSFLTGLTGTSDFTINSMWMGINILTLAGVGFVIFYTQSLLPLGLYFYGLVFWTGYMRLLSTFSAFSWLEGTGLITVFTVGLVFVFIASVIGMMTGSG